MTKPITEENLLGSWIHAHEEDDGGRLVFRRHGASLPPSRGRSGFELRPRGILIDRPIAAADGNEERGGLWTLDGDMLEMKSPSQPGRRMRIASVDAKRLVLEPA